VAVQLPLHGNVPLVGPVWPACIGINEINTTLQGIHRSGNETKTRIEIRPLRVVLRRDAALQFEVVKTVLQRGRDHTVDDWAGRNRGISVGDPEAAPDHSLRVQRVSDPETRADGVGIIVREPAVAGRFVDVSSKAAVRRGVGRSGAEVYRAAKVF